MTTTEQLASIRSAIPADLRDDLRADLRDSQLTAGQLAEEIIEQLTAASPVQP